MTDPVQSSSRWPARFVYVAVLLVTATAAAGITYLLTNIQDRKHEALEHYVKLENLTEDSIDPTLWQKNFPRQYDGYLRTADMTRARHGGSDAIDRLAGWRGIFSRFFHSAQIVRPQDMLRHRSSQMSRVPP